MQKKTHIISHQTILKCGPKHGSNNKIKIPANQNIINQRKQKKISRLTYSIKIENITGSTTLVALSIHDMISNTNAHNVSMFTSRNWNNRD